MKRRHFITHTLAGAALTTVGALANNLRAATFAGNKTLELVGTRPPTPTSYRRMFPGLKGNALQPVEDVEEGLRELGSAMKDLDPVVEPENQPGLPPAGYTYLGQFIDHDLTLDLTPLDAANPDVAQTQNFRTPFLDLDHVYGGGPNLSPFLYEKGNRNKERFLVGRTIKSGGLESSNDDLPRNSGGIALAGDPRQDENLVVAQLQVAFLKLHNKVIVDEGLLKTAYRRRGESDFAVAQRIVTWQYQWLVRHDYLKQVLDATIFNSLDALEKKKRADPHLDPRICVEFSAGAFRFGHSMVRDVYKTGVNNRHNKDVKLHEFFQQTGLHGSLETGLLAEWVVCWARFFEIPPRPSLINRVRKIDTQIANEMHHLDESTIKSFSALLPAEAVEPQLPIRTLLRGFRMGLPSGEKVAREVARQRPGTRILTRYEITCGPHKRILTSPKYGLLDNTPLWYYVLKEAEVIHQGERLGPVGSYILAEVIIGALAADRDSYFWGPEYPKWEPLFGRSMGQLMRAIVSNVDISPRCEPQLAPTPTPTASN